MISTKILPNLVCNLSDLNLSKSEFKSYLTTIQSLLKKIEEERLADPSGSIKEDESDMNKIMKEIEEMDKDQSKKNNEIFISIQGPSTSNDFDFLNLFEPGGSTSVVKQELTQTNNNNDLPINNNNLQMTKELSAGTHISFNNKPMVSNEINPQKNAVSGQKMDNNFDFFNEVDNNNKVFSAAPKLKLQNPGLFNQTVQMKKMQNNANNNNLTFNETNNNNNSSQNNSQNLFNNLNVNSKLNPMTLGNTSQQKTNIMPSNSITGNMVNLNYDPFSELDSKTNSNSNPFSKDPINLSSNNKIIINKSLQNQIGKGIENDLEGWKFEDFKTKDATTTSKFLQKYS